MFYVVLMYDIDVFDDCLDAKIYKCSTDNRILYTKVAPNQYQPVMNDIRIHPPTYVYTGIPTTLKNGYYGLPHQDLHPMFEPIDVNKQTPQTLMFIQEKNIQIDLARNALTNGNTIQKTQLQNILKLEFGFFNYHFRLLYLINESTQIAYPIWTDYKYTKNQLVYLSESALYWNITKTSIYVDILLEIIELAIVWLWNQLKQKIMSKQLNDKLLQANERKKIELERQINEYLQNEHLQNEHLQNKYLQTAQEKTQPVVSRSQVIDVDNVIQQDVNIVRI